MKPLVRAENQHRVRRKIRFNDTIKTMHKSHRKRVIL